MNGQFDVSLPPMQEPAFIRAWADLTLTQDDIAAKFGVSRNTVQRTRVRLGLPVRSHPSHTPKINGPRAEAEFGADWRNPTLSARVIANKWDISVQTACSTAARLKLPSKRRHRADLPSSGQERHGCGVCGGATGGRCGCYGRVA
jgi:hypothetical protein